MQALEENGIGRPSTYAPIIETLRQRKYVRMEKRSFVPTRLGFAVYDYLVDHFPGIMDIEFTARMEEDLDTVEQGERDWVELLREFYGPLRGAAGAGQDGGAGVPGGRGLPGVRRALQVRYSAYGKFAGCENYPECKYTRDLSGLPQAEAAEPEELEEACPECGGQAAGARARASGKFAGCTNYPKCKYIKDLSGRPAAAGAEGAGREVPAVRRAAGGAQQPAGALRGLQRLPQVQVHQGLDRAAGGRSRSPTDLPCEECGKPLVLRAGAAGALPGLLGVPQVPVHAGGDGGGTGRAGAGGRTRPRPEGE